MGDIVIVYNINSIQAMDILAHEVISILQSRRRTCISTRQRVISPLMFYINAGRIKPSGQQIEFVFLTLTMVYSLDYLFE